MAKTGLTLTFRVDGLKEVLRALNRLPKEANVKLRDRAQVIAGKLAGQVQAAGRAEGRQAAIVATTVKVRRDRVPVITVGGTARIGRNQKPAYALLFGSEFGSNRLRQYHPHLGRGSYWIFSTVDDQAESVLTEWAKAADAVVREFGGGR